MTQDEKLEEAKRLYETANADQRYVLESLFPELKESEDEGIRKRIIQALHGDVLDIEETSKAIAWLEKQSNTIPDECIFRPVAGCDIESAAKQAIKQQGILAKNIVLAFNGAYIPVKNKTQDVIVNEYSSWLEKQDKSNPYSGVSFEYNGHTWGMCARDNGVEILVDGEIKAELVVKQIAQPSGSQVKNKY